MPVLYGTVPAWRKAPMQLAAYHASPCMRRVALGEIFFLGRAAKCLFRTIHPMHLRMLVANSRPGDAIGVHIYNHTAKRPFIRGERGRLDLRYSYCTFVLYAIYEDSLSTRDSCTLHGYIVVCAVCSELCCQPGNTSTKVSSCRLVLCSSAA